MIIPDIFIKEDWYQIAHLMNEQESGGGKIQCYLYCCELCSVFCKNGKGVFCNAFIK